MKRKLTYLVAFAAASATVLGAAYAAKSTENDALSIATAKIGLGQAVAVAEGHVGGKAARAEYERNKAGQWVFDIEVVKDKTVMDVTVDAGSGNVLAAVVDKADGDDDHDKED
jgi:uncharacterized membrane protein YkoI